MTASGLLKNIVSIEEWKVASKKNKEKLYSEKKLFLAIKHSNLQGKKVFRNIYFGSQPFL